MGKQVSNIAAKIPVLFFKEGNKVIAFSPALDLSSCGDTEDKARSRFAEAAAIFLSEIADMGTLKDVLEECGWQKVPKQQKWAPPVFTAREERIRIPIRG